MKTSRSPTFKVDRHNKTTPPPASLLPPRKKKKKLVAGKSTELAVANKKQTKTLEKFNKLGEAMGKMTSTFGIKEREIMDAVANGNIEHAISVFQRQAYSTIVRLIPMAEKEYLKGKREHQLYALNSVITQGRELASDLMASGDRSQLANKLVEEVLEPIFKGVLQKVVEEMQHIKYMLSDKLPSEYKIPVSNELDLSMRKLATSMTEMYNSSSTQLRKNIIGD